jgi:threonine dehydrogenase-like Zn-dependent dehydrogenase
VYLDPRAVVHTITDDIQAEVATFAHPLASGYTWVQELAALTEGESVLILGPGPRGLSCVIAAQAAGAGWIGISGLDHDSDRLDLAAQLGANLTANIDVDDLGMAVAGSLKRSSRGSTSSGPVAG